MRNRNKWLFSIGFAWIYLLLHTHAYGMSEAGVNGDWKQSIIQLIQKKEDAVNARNEKQFLTTLDSNRNTYVQEQKRWFEDAVNYMEAKSFKLKVIEMSKEEDHLYKVSIYQSYKRKGKTYKVTYPLILRETKDGLKDHDIAFNELKKNQLLVRYSDSALKEQAKVALNVINQASQHLKKRYKWSPKHVEVKLYHDPELFRQSVKPSLPQWAIGWHESKESIKFVGGKYDQFTFSSGMVHELIHQMVSELTNDNAAYWLQEGAAMYYEAHLLPDLNKGYLDETNENNALYPLTTLEKVNLEILSDRDAFRYYYSTYKIFQFLINKYGEKGIQKWFASLKAYPELDMDSARKLKTINDRTKSSLQKSLGLSYKRIDEIWLGK